jgi:hypothetical protein
MENNLFTIVSSEKKNNYGNVFTFDDNLIYHVDSKEMIPVIFPSEINTPSTNMPNNNEYITSVKKSITSFYQ